MYTIASPRLTAQINPKGAELSSLVSKQTGREYLWQGDPAWWGGRAPVLFPILCGMRNNQYTYQGKTYPMPKHGFVRHEVFNTAETTPNRLTLTYTDNPKTHEMYPFPFLFEVIFEVTETTLATTYRVSKTGTQTAYFSVGAHEAFNCLWEKDETFEDYYLEFDTDANYHSEIITPEGLIDGKTYPVIQNGRILPLKHELFNNDALVFRNVPSRHVALKSKKSNTAILYDYQDAPHLGIWQKPGAPYICIEPWYGLPDEAAHNGDITQKYGIVALKTGDVFSWTHAITLKE